MEKLIEVKSLKKYFPIKKSSLFEKDRYLKAVDNVSFHINKGETLGLVGESGCGKSTTGRSIIRLFDITEGEILYKGKDISQLKESQIKPYRRKMQVIFQDPYSSLNPTLTVENLIAEPLDVSIQAQVVNMLEDLQQEFGLTYLFIAHDLSMVRHISHRIGVMYLGKLVEIGPSEEIYKNPLHPYTQALLASVLEPKPRKKKKSS